MGYLLCILGGFVLGATKGDDLQRTVDKTNDRKWSDY